MSFNRPFDGARRRRYQYEALESRLLLSATQLAFAANTNGAPAFGKLSSIVVNVEDASGTIASSDSSTVTLTLSSGVFSTGSNAVSVAAVSGVATFSGLIINNGGSYTLWATDGSLASATSNTFGIYTFGTLASFGNFPFGAYPGQLTPDSNGNFFSITSAGGIYNDGAVIEVAAGTGAVTILASFNGNNGSDPLGGVTLDANGNIFGTTDSGGVDNLGSIFEVARGSNAITTLASFNSSNGDFPHDAPTLDASGDLFGTTNQGGTSPNDGTVFELPHGSSTITTLVNFNGTDGELIDSALSLDANGDLFGSSTNGGTHSYGTLFEIAHGSSTLTTLINFSSSTFSGQFAIDSNQNLFGTTYEGGSSNDGTVFELASGTTTLTTLATFTGANGSLPEAGVMIDGSGNIFGTTVSGGNNSDGTVFEVAQGSGKITTLATFSGDNGERPVSGVIQDANGNLFGTTQAGLGVDDFGTLFEIPKAAGTINTLVSFYSSTGFSPQAGAIVDSSGNVYGTLSRGGISDDGGVFEVAAGSTTSTSLAVFNGTNGADPLSTLAIDNSGDLFGTTRLGGANGLGTVFEIANGTNAITKLASFSSATGSSPGDGLVLDSSGDIFGTTTSGKATVFEIKQGSSTLTTLTTFTPATIDPTGELVLDAAGDIFGATRNGGANSDGAIYELASGTNAATVLASFNSTNGASPQGGVTADASGNLYGATYSGGTAGLGTVYELPAGSSTITTLANFNSTVGGNATAPVVVDAMGNVYGTASDSGSGNAGAVFEVARGSNTVSDLDNDAVSTPYGVTIDSQGNIYGTSPYTIGNIFELAPAEPVLAFATAPASVTAGSPQNIQVSLQYPGRPIGGNYSKYVTLSLIGGAFPNGTNNLTVDTINGVANFLNVIVNAAGTYTMTAGASGCPPLTSSAFTVSTGPAALLNIASVPVSNTAGVSTVVNVQDAFGNIASTDTSTITLTLTGGTFKAGGTTVSAAAVNGVATFSNLDIVASGICTLTATDGNLAPASLSVYDAWSYSPISLGNPYPIGQLPRAVPAFDANGDLFGTTVNGGANGFGTVFEIAAGSSAITTIGTFNYSNGASPAAGVVLDSAGNVYGTAESGGTFDGGTVYEIPAGSSSITTLVNFNGSNGSSPFSQLVLDHQGNLVGTTAFGGTSSDGTVFRLALASNTLTTLYSFTTVGEYFNSGVVLDAAGDIFGSGLQGGANGDGYVFEIPAGSTSLTTLASFTGANGSNPQGNIAIDASGDLFGTTQQGGTPNNGTLFKIAAGTSSITTLATFPNAIGSNPNGVTLDSKGDLFGTTLYGGANNDGAVFELPQGSSTLTALAVFNGTNGASADAPVIADANGNVFGTTQTGGINNDGEVFEIAAGSSSISIIASFTGTVGGNPYGSVTFDSSGNLFGTTYGGGTSNDGTIFEVAPGSASATTIASFNGSNGRYPTAALSIDAAGNLFGDTSGGGTNNDGTVFEIVHGTAAIVTLASFSGTNGLPMPALTLDSNDNLFGTTQSGGTSGQGTVFEVANGSNAVTVLASFSSVTGDSPHSQLLIDSSGDLFGTASAGGPANYGDVFEIVHGSATVSIVAGFNQTNGATPYAGLIADNSGNLFGTTTSGGVYNNGTIFEIASGSNAVTTLAAFNSADGSDPQSPLTLDAHNDLFGTTLLGGASNAGTVFELAPGAPNIGTLLSLGDASGTGPRAGVTMDAAGNLFVTASGAGTTHSGTVFELIPASSRILPQVTGVAFSGSSWSPGFPAYGGYSIPTGSAQLTDLPWINLDTISITFNEGVNITQNSLTVAGVNQSTYAASAFSYNAATFTATWTFASAFGPDKLLLNLASAGSNAVTDASGNALDGEFTNGASSFPSGNGAAGGDFNFNVNILPGDVDGNGSVSIVDTIATRNRQFTAPGSANYLPAFDVDGNGSISIIDTIDVRNRQFTALPAGIPSLPQTSSIDLQPPVQTRSASNPITPAATLLTAVRPMPAKPVHPTIIIAAIPKIATMIKTPAPAAIPAAAVKGVTKKVTPAITKVIRPTSQITIRQK
ncbi:MAG TPA: choice-of-anchor tandem repeat GloVer-containing protein [Tepidisphaeraceae bacterium]|jgi:uncharacterized repeat protein (TIGR03803 family)|nr:choice-of-anchor tandem repeat GloVer-containing protein [Tepidisphaeraceae bacterium]